MLFGTSSLFRARAAADSNVYSIPTETISGIPAVQWKLQEIFKRRLAVFETFFMFQWRDEYRVNVAEIDRQHQTMFESVGKLSELIDRGDSNEAQRQVQAVIDHIEHHVDYEEQLMEKHGYAGLDSQREEHRRLMDELATMREMDAVYLVEFVKGWLLSHTLVEDRKYEAFFAEKGIQG